MQYIKKTNTPPANWDQWFTTANGRRSYDYGHDYQNLPQLFKAKKHLLDEQHGLCAYCQSRLIPDTASIEHLVPKEYNKELSTDYYNLVAVCLNPLQDEHNGRRHCDKERGSLLLTPIIQYQNAEVTNAANHAYFRHQNLGEIIPKRNLPADINNQVHSFINILNINHTALIYNRSAAINGILQVFQNLPNHQRRFFWELQRNRILMNPNQEYRQFLLIYISTKLGIN